MAILLAPNILVALLAFIFAMKAACQESIYS